MLRAAVSLARSAAAATAVVAAGESSGHDSSVMSRYSAYSANHVITTTAATSRISKNSTTARSLTAGRKFSRRLSNGAVSSEVS